MLKTFFATLRFFTRWLLWPLHRLTRKPCDVLRFTLKGAPPPLPKKRDLWWDRRPPPMSIRTFQRRLDRAIDDPALTTILIDIKDLETGWSTTQTLYQLISSARAKGKSVVAHLPEGGGLREYLLATAANEIWLAPSAVLSLTGIGIEATYFASAIEKAGLRGQVEAMGRYKTAGEPYTRDKMSPENAETLGEIVDEIQRLLCAAIEETRKIGPVAALDLLGAGPYGPKRALELGLIDDVSYPDQLSSKLAPEDKSKAKIRRWPVYAHGRHQLALWPLGRKKLPVIEIKGVLVEGKARFKSMVSSKDVVKLLRKARKDRKAPAVVLYIDSRGGTVGASDQIRREVERLGQKKPVVAYLANVAASGGYMVASAAQQIVAQEAAITGSIGVISWKISGQRLLEKLGISRQKVRRGAHNSFESPAEGWSATERRALKEVVEDHYRLFIDTVARGRRMPADTVEASAEGRVWTGRAAQERGLVDKLGSLSDAISLARETAPEAKTALVKPLRPRKKKLPEMLLPGAVVDVLTWTELAESRATWAIEPFELRIR